MMNNKAKALADYLKVSEVYVDKSDHNYYGTTVSPNSKSHDGYMVYNNQEATFAAMDTIRDMPWILPIEFLADYTGLPDSIFVTLEALEETEAILALVETKGSFESFALSAIDTVGRGYLLSPMIDDDEIELEGGYYAYRVV